MRLILEKHKGGWEASLDTKLGVISVRDFLRPRIEKYKRRRAPEVSYTDLMAAADISHAQYYEYINGRLSFTIGILNLLMELGYNVEMVRRENG